MASLPISGSEPAASLIEIRFLDLAGQTIAAPLEWSPALVEIDLDPDCWQACELRLNDAPLLLSLRAVGGQVRIIAEWPRSGPGHYRLSLTVPPALVHRTVTISPQKISNAAYAQLLDDLETRLPVMVALGMQRAGGLAGVTLPPPGESTISQEVIRLTRAIEGTSARPGLVQVLEELAGDPHIMLRHSERWIRSERARRPHPSRLAQALAIASNLDTDQRPIRLLDARVDPSVDTYENRLVALFTDQVRMRLRRLIRLLRSPAHADTLVHMEAMQRHLAQAIQRATFLSEVTRPVFLPDRTTMVLLKRPPYRAALAGYLELHRSIAVRIEEPALDSPLENLPWLYQLWGTLHVISVLLDVAPLHGYVIESQRLVERDAGSVFIRLIRNGVVALSLRHPGTGTTIRCIPERTYGSMGSLRSISYQQIPDVAVEIEHQDGSTRLVLFDPKYKLDGELLEGETIDGKPKKVDIDKMHAYRDAIRDRDLRRVVRSAAILYPGPEIRFADGIEAIAAYPGKEAVLTDRLYTLLSLVWPPELGTM